MGGKGNPPNPLWLVSEQLASTQPGQGECEATRRGSMRPGSIDLAQRRTTKPTEARSAVLNLAIDAGDREGGERDLRRDHRTEYGTTWKAAV